MSIKKINLRKLLQLFYADNRLQRRLLLQNISDDRRKTLIADPSNGGDFYGPFWADAKDHVAGRSNLREQTKMRIADNKGRARLYPILTDSFLYMWNEKMRWRNEPFEFMPETLKAHLPISTLGAVIKIQNIAGITLSDGSHRVIYPYFSELPALPQEGACLGFWALKEALPDYPLEDFRIIDLQRRGCFRAADVGMKGDEKKKFLQKYKALIDLWESLQEERGSP